MPIALIVEDEAIIAMDLATELQDLGVDVAGVAKTYEQALELAGRAVPDLAVVDIVLNGAAHGMRIAEALVARGVKVLMISGSMDMRHRPKDLAFLSKPWNRDDLAEMIGGMLTVDAA
jgi:CheY-like chemotaxis protein